VSLLLVDDRDAATREDQRREEPENHLHGLS
jgi:hypothetical protein